MTFLALVLGLALHRFWREAPALQSDAWFDRWRAAVGGYFNDGITGLAVVVLPPALVVGLLGGSIDGLLFGVPWIVLAALLLVYCLGRGDLSAAMTAYRRRLREGALPDGGPVAGAAAPGSLEARHQCARRDFWYRSLQGGFAVVFYFVLFGPAWAFAYRLLQLCAPDDRSGVAQRVLYLADWLPARLLAVAYALAGDFLGCRDELLDALLDPGMVAPAVLDSVGVAALGPAPEPASAPGAFAAQAARQVEEVEDLIARVNTGWLAVLALWVIFA